MEASKAFENLALEHFDPWMQSMRRGDYVAAFAISDEVLRRREMATRDDPRLPYHRRWVWNGRPVDGRDVLVRCYHGLGDTLQFSRFLAPLRARAASVTVEVQAELVELLRALPCVDRWIAFRLDQPATPREVDLEIMELPHALRLTPHDVGPPAMRVDGLRLAEGPAWGLCWHAGDWDRRRSVPAGALVAAARRPDTGLVSLQRGAGAADAGSGFLNPGDADTDVVRTARLIMGVDRVVTVDTMVAHLAGTLGVPTLLLLHADADWRWLEGRADSPWYPSLRFLRQDVADDWSGPLRALRQAAAGPHPAAG